MRVLVFLCLLGGSWLAEAAVMGRKRPARGSGAAKVTAAILTEIPITATVLIIMPERIRGPTPEAGVGVDQSRILALLPEAKSPVSLRAKILPDISNISVKSRRLLLGKSDTFKLKLWHCVWKSERKKKRQSRRP